MYPAAEEIRDSAKRRIADIFHIGPETLTPDTTFGRDLKASFVSDFRSNEFDQLHRDVRDVADREILKELDSGALVIGNVGEYCAHMVRCFRVRPKEVLHVLGIGNSREW